MHRQGSTIQTHSKHRAGTDACTKNLNLNVFETRVESDACTQQGTKKPNVFDQGSRRQMLVPRHGTIIQRVGNTVLETDACTQTRIHIPNVFETQGGDNACKQQGTTF